MQRYQIIQKAGSGHFSEVFKAKDLQSGQIVAVKDLNYSQQIQKLLMKELQILSCLDHPNTLRMMDVVRSPQQIRVVSDYMEQNLLELYTTSKHGINENQLRCILYQCALGLQYLHKKRIIHRDIKPENIMINRRTGTQLIIEALVKLIDFGLAKEQLQAKTDYVATRWYRSPENLVGLKKSTVNIDIYALGCVAIELFNRDPLFPGSDTVDQLSKIFSLLGTPSQQVWLEGFQQLKRKNVTFDFQPRKGVSCVIPNASPQFKDLMERMLQLDPKKRISAKDMLYHPFFVNIHKMIPAHIYKYAPNLLTPIKSKPSTSITEVTRNPSASIDGTEVSQLVANAGIANNQRLAKTTYVQKNTTAPSMIQHHTIDPKQSQNANLGQPLRGNSLSMNMSINHLSTKQPPKKVYLSPQRPIVQSLSNNSGRVIAPVQNSVTIRQSRRIRYQSPQQNPQQNSMKPTSTINIFIPLRR